MGEGKITIVCKDKLIASKKELNGLNQDQIARIICEMELIKGSLLEILNKDRKTIKK